MFLLSILSIVVYRWYEVITFKLTASGLLLIFMQALGEFYIFYLNRIPDMLPHFKLFIASHFQPLFVNKWLTAASLTYHSSVFCILYLLYSLLDLFDQ